MGKRVILIVGGRSGSSTIVEVVNRLDLDSATWPYTAADFHRELDTPFTFPMTGYMTQLGDELIIINDVLPNYHSGKIFTFDRHTDQFKSTYTYAATNGGKIYVGGHAKVSTKWFPDCRGTKLLC